MLDRAWFEALASDPGGLRLRIACRTTLSVVLTAAILVPGLVWHALPVAAPATALMLALLTASLPREPAPRQRFATILAMAAAAMATTLLTALLGGAPLLGQAAFLAILFAAVAAQSWGVRAVPVGLAAVVHTYLGLFLHVEPAQVPPILLAIVAAVGAVGLVGFALVREPPLAALRRLVRAVERQGAKLVHASLDAARDRSPPARLRLRRLFGELNETVLMAGDHLAATGAGGGPALDLALLRFELALISLSSVIIAAGPMSRRDAAVTRLLARRLAVGRRGALRARPASPAAPLGPAIAEVDAAALALAQALAGLAQQQQGGTTAGVPPAAPRPAPAWRPAIRATAAAFLSMAGGQLISPDRWFWAVLTAYLVFLGARSSGDAIHKGLERVGGTLLGLVAGVLVSVAVAGHPVAEAGALVVCIFALAYVFALSQVLAIFCVTIMLGLIYGLIGTPAETILIVRLEETAIGALAAAIVSVAILPAPTEEHVGRVGGDLVAALARVLRESARRLAGDAAAAPVGELRRADRLLRDLRLALRPLRARRTLVWWAQRPSELPAILACVFWVRVLAMVCATEPPAGDREPMRRAITALADRLDAVAAPGAPEAAPGGSGAHPLEIGALHVGRTSTALMELAIGNLETIVALMRERFHRDGWAVLVARRPL